MRNKVGKDLEYYVKKAGVQIGEKVLKDATDYGVKEAEKGYLNAIYDGTVDDIKVYGKKQGGGDYILYAEGPQVAAIEYGSGDFSEKSTVGPKVLFNKETGEAFWFYIQPVGNEFKTKYGGPKKVYDERYVKEYGSKYSHTKTTFFKDAAQAQATWAMQWRKGEVEKSDYEDYTSYMREMFKSNTVYRKEVTLGPDGKKHLKFTKDKSQVRREDADPEKGPWSGLVDSSEYGYTRGNEPQHVMRDTKDKILEYIRKKYA